MVEQNNNPTNTTSRSYVTENQMNLKGQSIAEYHLYEGPNLVANETIKYINKKKGTRFK